MNIINNSELRELFIKGLKYILFKAPNAYDYKNAFMLDINKHILKIINNTKMDKKSFDNWLLKTEQFLTNKLTTIKERYII